MFTSLPVNGNYMGVLPFNVPAVPPSLVKSISVSYTHLDVYKRQGCGTAVLGILARMKGAASVVAVDIDEFAVELSLIHI